jgi:hypothetical protein
MFQAWILPYWHDKDRPTQQCITSAKAHLLLPNVIIASFKYSYLLLPIERRCNYLVCWLTFLDTACCLNCRYTLHFANILSVRAFILLLTFSSVRFPFLSLREFLLSLRTTPYKNVPCRLTEKKVSTYLFWIYRKSSVRGSAVGWGTALHAGKSWVRFLMGSQSFRPDPGVDDPTSNRNEYQGFYLKGA